MENKVYYSTLEEAVTYCKNSGVKYGVDELAKKWDLQQIKENRIPTNDFNTKISKYAPCYVIEKCYDGWTGNLEYCEIKYNPYRVTDNNGNSYRISRYKNNSFYLYPENYGVLVIKYTEYSRLLNEMFGGFTEKEHPNFFKKVTEKAINKWFEYGKERTEKILNFVKERSEYKERVLKILTNMYPEAKMKDKNECCLYIDNNDGISYTINVNDKYMTTNVEVNITRQFIENILNEKGIFKELKEKVCVDGFDISLNRYY